MHQGGFQETYTNIKGAGRISGKYLLLSASDGRLDSSCPGYEVGGQEGSPFSRGNKVTTNYLAKCHSLMKSSQLWCNYKRCVWCEKQAITQRTPYSL